MSDTLGKGKKSNFNQAVWLGIGSFSSLILSFISAAILSRYFDKVEYGSYRQILYVYNTLITLFTLGLPSVFAYFIPRLNSGEQKTLVNKLTQLFVLLGALFGLLLFSGANIIASLLGNPDLSVGLRIFSLFPLFTLPTMGIEGIYTALRQTKFIAYFQIASRVLSLVCIICPVLLFHSGYIGAVIGWGISSFLIFLIAMYLKWRPYKGIKSITVPQLYRQVLGYSLPLMGAFLAGFFLHSADQFFVSRYYGTAVFAVMANGCISIPILGMVAGSVKNILLPLFSKADKEKNMSSAVSTYSNAVKQTAIICFPILIFCEFFAPEITSFIFGTKYVDSGNFLRLYILRDFASCFPFFAVLMALGKSKFYMNIHILGAIYVWLADFICIIFELPAELIVFVSSLFSIGSTIASGVLVYRTSNINLIPKRLLIQLFVILLHSCTFACIIKWTTLYINTTLFVSLLCSSLIFAACIILTGKFIKIDYLYSIKSLIKK